jgi:nitroreductase
MMADGGTLYELMRSRRSVRRFKPDPPGRERIERLLAAAVTAPSASNKQPWRFFVVSSRERIAAMAAAVREAVERIAGHIEPAHEESFRAYGAYFTRFEAAPVVIAALHRPLRILSNLVDPATDAADRERIEAMESSSGLIGTAMALQNLLLAAHEEGLGASGMTGPLVASDQLRELLEVPPSWTIAALVPIGYADEDPAPTGRKPLDAVVRWIDS